VSFAPLELRILSVNVARPQLLGLHSGEAITSAIQKQALQAKTVEVGKTNLGGDAQADLEHHGGPDKAVYAYPADHWPWWEDQHNFPCRPAAFGENLTVKGGDETSVAIGDRFQWGNAVLEITQPRMPCYKFQFHSARMDAGALMTLSARCGWYFRVLVEGTGPVADGRLVRMASGDGPSVRETFLAAFGRRFDPSRRQEIAATKSLSAAWRKRLTAAVT
jgi:MOSC domain-containing protein YiiM